MTRRLAERHSLHIGAILIAFAILIALVPSAHAQSQQAKPTFIAPVPPILQTAQTVFISDGGTDPDVAQRLTSNNPATLPFNQFYQLMQEWGRFRIVTSPSDADLVLEVSAVGIPGGAGSNCPPYKFQVAVIDGKSKIRMRTVVGGTCEAMLTGNLVNNFTAVTRQAFRDFQLLTAPAAAQ